MSGAELIESLVPDKPFFRIAEVATLLGVPVGTVYSWARANLLPVVRIGMSDETRRSDGAVLVARPDLVSILNRSGVG